MKNALILTGIWLGILVTAYAIVFWDQGIDRPLPISVLEQAAQTAAAEYIQPDGLFSVSIPTGWTVSEEADYVRLADPNEVISVWVVAAGEDGLEASVEEALNTTGAGMLTMSSVEPLPSGTWDGQEYGITYVTAQGDEQLDVRLRRPDAWTVLLLAQGREGALDALSQNLDAIWNNLAIPAEELVVL